MVGVSSRGGLSPRGRGKRGLVVLYCVNPWSIPAWAGETGTLRAPVWVGKVYPRVGGGNFVRYLLRYPARGLSPRGRGKPKAYTARRASRRSIPAWAGETIRIAHRAAGRWVYPRVGGGNP